jgi:hypothetical protein
MEDAHLPELWRDLYVMLGTSSAALIGLLFVVTSLHLDDVVKNPVFRVRAYNGTLYLLILRNCPGWFAAWSARLTVAGQGLLGA